MVTPRCAENSAAFAVAAAAAIAADAGGTGGVVLLLLVVLLLVHRLPFPLTHPKGANIWKMDLEAPSDEREKAHRVKQRKKAQKGCYFILGGDGGRGLSRRLGL